MFCNIYYCDAIWDNIYGDSAIKLEVLQFGATLDTLIGVVCSRELAYSSERRAPFS